MDFNDSLDTNLIVRYIVNDIPGQRDKVIKLLDSGKHRLNDLVLSETVYVLSCIYHFTREEISDQLLFFLTRYDDTIIYNHSLTALAFPLYLAHPKLSFSDCLLASYAELEHATPLYTFDKKLASQVDSTKLLA